MVPLEFLRQFRFLGYAIFDLIATFLVIYLLAPGLSKIFLKIGIRIPKLNWIYLALPLGILTHLLVGKITPMTHDFIDLQGHYFLKILILILLFLGLKGIKRTKIKQKTEKHDQ
jgi:uncharacterized membrane protein